MALDLKRRAQRVGRTLQHWDWTQRIVALVIASVVVFLLWSFVASVIGGISTARQTRRDTQHNTNVAADLGAADSNHNSADAHEDKRLEADGRYQESERSVGLARGRADAARSIDEEATRRHEETRRRRTSDVPDVTDDDVCTELRSVNISAVGCGEK